MRIVIPTLGRIDKQLTYNSLPNKYKEQVTFVVQSHEYEDMKSIFGDKVVSLPSNIKTIAPTREWIHKEFGNGRYLVCDDDCHAWHYKEPVIMEGKEVWGFKNGVSREFNDSDFDNLFEEVNKLMDSGIVHIGILNSSMKPTSEPNRYPIRSNERIGGIVFYDGPNVPKDLQWTRPFDCEIPEDIDVNLQLLSRGYENRVLTKYCFCISETSAAGGCEVYRNVQNHNEAQRVLANLWPGIINIREKVVPSGPWKGQTKLNITVQWKKALNSKKSEGVLDEFFV